MHDAIQVRTGRVNYRLDDYLPAEDLYDLEGNRRELNLRRELEIKATLEQLSVVKSTRSEELLVKSWEPRWKRRQPHQQWVAGIDRAASWSDLDVVGVDVVLQTKLDFLFTDRIPSKHRWRSIYRQHLPFGAIPLQVKSHIADAIAFEKHEKKVPIPVVVISEFDVASKLLRQKTLFAVLSKFPDLAEQINRKGVALSPRMMQQLESVEPGILVLGI